MQKPWAVRIFCLFLTPLYNIEGKTLEIESIFRGHMIAFMYENYQMAVALKQYIFESWLSQNGFVNIMRFILAKGFRFAIVRIFR